jgi:DNA-binding NarL/FixJ family response regulator
MAGGAGLVGREPERRVLGDRLDRAAAGEGGLLLLAGQAGVGKTSLAEATLAARAVLVLRGGASEQGRTPYAPITTALRAYERALEHTAAYPAAIDAYTSRAAEELRALGEPVEARSAGLSRREVEVLRLAADGLTNREIATRLFLSKRTVDMHVRNLLAKLGCRSRVQAAQRARSLQLLE